MKLPLPDYLGVVMARMLTAFPFFGILVSSTMLVESPERAGDTAATDGSAIYYNPEFIESLRQQNDMQVAFVLAHEVLHCALGHLWRIDDRDPNRWNRACDIVINRILRDAGLPAPDGALTATSEGLDPQAEQLSEEEIYQLLKPSPPAVWLLGNDMLPPAGQPGQQAQQVTPRSATAEAWRDRMLAAAAAAKLQGNLPAGIQRIVDDLVAPQIDWRTALAEFVTQSRSDYSWRHPDRRILASCGLYLPTLHSDALEDIVVGIDTSGSISQAELADFLSELYGILQACTEVRAWVLSCDAKIHAVVQADGQTPLEELLDTVRGGGGTDFRPVFEWIEEHGINPSCVVYLTDGYGTYPDTQPSYPVLWVLGKDHKQPPWGKTTVIAARQEAMRARAVHRPR